MTVCVAPGLTDLSVLYIPISRTIVMDGIIESAPGPPTEARELLIRKSTRTVDLQRQDEVIKLALAKRSRAQDGA